MTREEAVELLLIGGLRLCFRCLGDGTESGMDKCARCAGTGTVETMPGYVEACHFLSVRPHYIPTHELNNDA